MKTSELPKFIVEKRTVKRNLKTARKAAAKRGAGRFEGDTGTPDMKLRQKVTLEVRERSSTGHATMVGARVEAQLPLDRYKNRCELDPTNAWRNLMLWEAAERLRNDFHASGLAPKVCGSFEPRVTGGKQTWDADSQVDALRRYKKAMNAVAQTLRGVVFYVTVGGESANDWARRNAMIPQAGLAVLRLGLQELAHHYGLVKLTPDASTAIAASTRK